MKTSVDIDWATIKNLARAIISMKVLVTGALGFIGSHICKRLVREGHDVSALDNMHTGSEDNVAGISESIKTFRLGSGEIENTNETFDAIIHQGIYSSSPMYRENPHLASKALDDWISILEYARKNNSRIVFASSSSLYNGNDLPFREDMGIRVTDIYTEARYAIERMATLYNDLYSVRSVGLRYFSVYGPHEKAKGSYANLISQFLWGMKEGKRPLIFGDGSQSRDFIHVDDVVEANMLALSSGGSGIFNVGTGKDTSLNDVVELINQKLATDIEPEYQENRIKNYIQHTLAETSKAEKELGFSAGISLDEGVARLISHYS
jgi:UDP-glucose 4-epimerase